MRNGIIPNSDPSKSRWDDAGSTPVKLPATDTNSAKNIIYDNGKRVYHPPGEIGPAILRPDGTVFDTGAACTVKGPSTRSECLRDLPADRPHRDLRHGRPGPGRPAQTSPHMEGAGDTWASLLPNGNVLLQTNPPGITDRCGSLAPTLATRASATARCIPSPPKPKRRSSRRVRRALIWRLYEFDGTNLIPEPAADFLRATQHAALADRRSDAEPPSSSTSPRARFRTRGGRRSRSSPQDINPGGNYQIFGTQFNGLSQANAFGDEFQVSTNFPLVRITNNATGDVKYAHTYNFSTMAVATGSATVSTWFDVPTNTETGDSTLEVVANGIPSLPVNVTVVAGGAVKLRTELRQTCAALPWSGSAARLVPSIRARRWPVLSRQAGEVAFKSRRVL